MTDDPYIVFDWCGFGDRYGRFTSMPDGKTLVCQAWMAQSDWDKAQLEWFKQFDGRMTVCRCESGPYRKTEDVMGTVGEIVERLRIRCE